MPYKHNSEEKFRIKTKEDYDYIKRLLDDGASVGSLRYKYHINRKMLKIIENDWMSFEEHIVCTETGKKLKEVTNRHTRPLGFDNREDFIKKYRCKLTTFPLYLKRQKNGENVDNISKESKERRRKALTGRKHSKETKAKLSVLFAGNNNPAKRLDVRKKLRDEHMSRTDPERWASVVKQIGDAQRGRKKTPEHLAAIKEGWKRSSKFGSKSQRYAFEYLRKYFVFNYGVKVFGNDNTPFKPHTDKFTVDISIPEFRVAIEWDGVWHRKAIISQEHLARVNANDTAKTKILDQNGWKLVRVKDECKNGHVWRSYVRERCRELIRGVLADLMDRDKWEEWKSEYPVDAETRIALKDLAIPQMLCKHEGCERMVSINSRIGLCHTCRVREWRRTKKSKELELLQKI